MLIRISYYIINNGRSKEKRGGCIYPHQRDTVESRRLTNNDDDAATIIKKKKKKNQVTTKQHSPIVNYTLTRTHKAQIACTKSFQRKIGKVNENRNRIKVLKIWCKIHFPDFAKAAIKKIVDMELNDSSKIYLKCTEDFIYEKIDEGIVTTDFLSVNRRNKKTGKVCQMRKFYDVIIFGAEQAPGVLQQNYFTRSGRAMAFIF